jgi:hypothetical protein
LPATFNKTLAAREIVHALFRGIATMCALLLTAAAAAQQPPPVVTEYLKTLGAGALIEREDNTASVHFVITLEWRKRLSSGAVVDVEFLNKQDPLMPYITSHKVDTHEDRFDVRSPAYPCVSNNSAYTATAKIYSDATRSTLLSEHAQFISFHLPPHLFRQLRLKDCRG